PQLLGVIDALGSLERFELDDLGFEPAEGLLKLQHVARGCALSGVAGGTDVRHEGSRGISRRRGMSHKCVRPEASPDAFPCQAPCDSSQSNLIPTEGQ